MSLFKLISFKLKSLNVLFFLNKNGVLVILFLIILFFILNDILLSLSFIGFIFLLYCVKRFEYLYCGFST